MTKADNIIIGAGPAGLAIAGQLRKMGLSFEILEQTDKIASAWHQHYDRLHLHTVKSLSSLPHMDFPKEYPEYVHKDDLIKYYQAYAKTFDIKPHFNSTVTSVVKSSDHWVITCSNATVYETKNVIIATGINRIPKVPTWEGQQDFKGTITHSSRYKNPSSFLDKKVLIVGMGNTGAEVALDLANSNVDVSLSIRSDITLVPRDLFGSPVQLTAKILMKLPFGLDDVIAKMVRKAVFGDLEKYGIRQSKLSAIQFRLMHGKTPIIDLGTIAKVKEGKIKILKDVKSFKEDTVLFVDGLEKTFDAVILATGYYAKVDSFLHSAPETLDSNGEPTVKVGANAAQGLYFIGYEKYSFDGLLGVLKEDALLISADIEGRMGMKIHEQDVRPART